MNLKNKMLFLFLLSPVDAHVFATENTTSVNFVKNIATLAAHPDITKKQNSDEKYSTSTVGLPLVNKTKIVYLKDGDNYTLTASLVKQKIRKNFIRNYAYNGSIPGPIIEVEQGAKVNIKFVNNTDIEQTIHPHGLRIDYHFDGIPGISQKSTVKPGESFNYELFFPDVAVFWYHPHVAEDYAQNRGLYGNFIVRPKDKNFYESVNKEIILILNDVLIGKNVENFYKNYTNYAAMGRYGNVMLLNGSENFSAEVNQGDIVRFYLTNAANTRTFNFTIPNAKIKLVAGDMSKYENEKWVNNIILAPGERYIVDVLFDKSGKYKIENSTQDKTRFLGSINVTNKKTDHSFKENFNKLHKDEQLISEIDKLKPHFEKPIDKTLIMSVKMGMDMKHDNDGDNSDKIEWEDPMPDMNAMMTSKGVVWKLIDADTKKENMDIDWKFKKGSYYKIKLFNDPNSVHPMQHPIHFHGQRFLVLSINNVKNTNFVWKDTVLVPRGDTVEILLETSNLGKWMAHCHISEHLSSGMMLRFDVDK